MLDNIKELFKNVLDATALWTLYMYNIYHMYMYIYDVYIYKIYTMKYLGWIGTVP